MTRAATDRDRAKADRHAAILEEAARLFAERGFSGVSLEDLGSAVGVSGPALYRHFANKQALLGAILVEVSERLLSGGREVVGDTTDADAALAALIAFHVDFAIADSDVIRVQDRDLASLAEDDRHTVRRLQREYVELWIEQLSRLHPDRDSADLRVRAHACFGLINSTPHSVRALRSRPADADVRRILHSLATAALHA
ncbi:AcrR family transcriptional regulator [Microbacterium terrae]|uniref:HTH-type transcriptional repressor KstR2 n=1 Tax=Microbacterium terrae TaxID=69369 RepID=A0A0M2GWE4_9MICO|nr:TetR/AcrR family transcriptional regulator [Microbacterium terrae]KJL38064.1 HTH-type transcriptional repressor KstR2 [Microbacterium terrae]MBP1077476.1 AcrR family transcriptional regulator [Microbacterium terrae]GLJ99082.1 putative transcriptional regulator, TetR family protein [Microbacterium terrae]